MMPSILRIYLKLGRIGLSLNTCMAPFILTCRITFGKETKALGTDKGITILEKTCRRKIMSFIDKTKPPPAGVWLLTRAAHCGEHYHFCVKSNSYWYNTRRTEGAAKWDSGSGVAAKIPNTEELVSAVHPFNPYVPGDTCRLLHIADAEWAETITSEDFRMNQRALPILPTGFWERNPPFSDRREDETY
jgi:hypothetical protein